MRKLKALLLIAVSIFILNSVTQAQCSICTKTAQQMGEGPAKALNTGIVYLMLAPFAAVGFIGYRWWKSNQARENEQI